MDDEKPIIRAIEFECTVNKVTTLADFGKRLYLDMPEGTTEQAKVLMDWHEQQVAIIATLIRQD